MLLDAFFPSPATLLFRAFLASLYSINQFSLFTSRCSHLLFGAFPLSSTRRQRISGIQIYKDTPKGTITSYYRPFEVSCAPMSAQGCKVLEIISQRGETMRGRGREIRRNSWLKASKSISNPFDEKPFQSPGLPEISRQRGYKRYVPFFSST